MRTKTLSIRIRKDLKDKMDELKDIEWRKEIENFIEKRIKEIEALKLLEEIDKTLSDVQTSKEAAWQTIREFREKR